MTRNRSDGQHSEGWTLHLLTSKKGMMMMMMMMMMISFSERLADEKC